ncbi:type II secretion system minor pseudopilin GspI [Xylophilus sp. GOD-11R]|uniref:type II secretion system minor pseudopilin GspI n=1 Tax=Xylophilus sp. GOD-11R TaxID=3089814 RepID=UPI00298C7380|nr:type II secretion system minor pseudopilin GspI [Xylophilus sp. GOD-11R]WPB57497.1 type II secretion system minor pseudopilin GspI [Xylophilus sp. GOD-11R]
MSTPSRIPTRTRRRPMWGFTLVEVLVAVAIVAIALMAGMQATSALTRNAQRQSDSVLAQLCASNELTRVRLTRQLPSVADNDVSCEQAGQVLHVRVSIRPTPNPSFRRVDAAVDDGRYPILKLSTVVGRY